MADVLSFDLSVRYPDFTLQAQADIPASGITVLSGPSGSGKTTLLRALAGLEPRAEGTVRLGGEDWSRRRPAARGTGFVFQDALLFPHLSVAGNLDYGARRRGTSPAQVAAVIAALDLGALLPRAPATLSGGEARRVALGRALASGPRILLLDEPLAGLDRARKDDLIPYVARAVAAFAVPALYVTHSAHETAALADRVLSIAGGRLTGWTPAAPRLTARVRQAEGGRVALEVGGQTLWLAGPGQVGETWAIPLGEGVLLSARPPGASTAALTLPGTLIQAAPDGPHLQIEIAGQRLSLPVAVPEGAQWPPGQMLWLSLPKLLAYPIGPATSD